TPGFTTAPEAAELLGENLNPARIEMRSSGPSNLISLQIKGVRRLDVWLSPRLIDFKRRPELRINNRPYRAVKGPVKLDLETMLDDLRLRGDRQQIYWYRLAVE